MSKNIQLGPVIEQRQFIFDGHGFWVPLRIGRNVRFAKDQIRTGKRRAKARHGAARSNLYKRVTPTKYFKFPPAPKPQSCLTSEDIAKMQARMEAWAKEHGDQAAVHIRNLQAQLLEAPSPFALPNDDFDLLHRKHALQAIMQSHALYYSHSGR